MLSNLTVQIFLFLQKPHNYFQGVAIAHKWLLLNSNYSWFTNCSFIKEVKKAVLPLFFYRFVVEFYDTKNSNLFALHPWNPKQFKYILPNICDGIQFMIQIHMALRKVTSMTSLTTKAHNGIAVFIFSQIHKETPVMESFLRKVGTHTI